MRLIVSFTLEFFGHGGANRYASFARAFAVMAKWAVFKTPFPITGNSFAVRPFSLLLKQSPC